LYFYHPFIFLLHLSCSYLPGFYFSLLFIFFVTITPATPHANNTKAKISEFKISLKKKSFKNPKGKIVIISDPSGKA